MDLTDITTIVTHKGCPDGVASAIILAYALVDAEVIFVQHNTPELNDLPAQPGMLFCDITPPRHRVAEFVEVGAVVLDHHRAQRDVVEAFGGRGVFADEDAEPGVSGAVLAYRVLRQDRGPHRKVATFAALAGVRDTWQQSSPFWDSACAQAAALRFWPIESLLRIARAGDWDSLDAVVGLGPVLLRKDAERDAERVAEAHRFTHGRIRCLVFEGRETSNIPDMVDGEIDLVLGWHYLVEGGKQKLVVSCRSRGDVSALSFAVAHGGGGHVRAAGFKVDAPTDNPYVALERMVGAAFRLDGPGGTTLTWTSTT